MSRPTLSRKTMDLKHAPRYPTPPPDWMDRIAALTPGDMAISRRQLLQLAGTAAVASSGAEQALAATARTTVSCTATVLKLTDGVRSWRLDAARFGPSARLSSSSRSGVRRVLLTGAVWPGTDLPADATLEFDGVASCGRIRVHVPRYGLDFEVHASDWLAGRAASASAVRLGAISTALGPDLRLTLSGFGSARLRPDWSISIDGAGCAQLATASGELLADSVRLWTPAPGDSSLIARPPRRRTAISLERGSQVWSPDAMPVEITSGICVLPDVIERITIEAATSSAGTRIGCALLESDSETPAASFSPARMGRRSVKSGSVVLSDLRYAFDLDDSTRYSARAQLAPGESWVHLKGLSIAVGRNGGSDALAIDSVPGSAPRVRFVPVVRGMAAPMVDALAGPLVAPGEKGEKRELPPSTVAGAIVALADATAVDVIRPDDMLSLRFEFFNLSLSGSGTSAKLTRTDRARRAYLVVEFPPQHVLEEAFLSASASAIKRIASMVGASAYGAPPVSAFLSGPSRVALTLPDARADAGIPYSLESLLDWTGCSMSVAPAAVDPPAPTTRAVHAPVRGSASEAPETSIEAPWGLFLSPPASAVWKHRKSPAVRRGVSDMWHTSLQSPDGGPSTLRAIWARSYDVPTPAGTAPNFRNSFSAADLAGYENRRSLVLQTGVKGYAPVAAKQLMLSPLGAWLDLNGSWWTYSDAIVKQWVHKAAMGRDLYVEIVREGVLYPWGHRATLTVITQRQFQPAPSGENTAYLVQRMFITITEPYKNYDYSASDASQGAKAMERLFPFQSVEFTTSVTPDIEPITVDGPGIIANVGGQEFLFEAKVVGADGGAANPIRLNAIWVDGAYSITQSALAASRLRTSVDYGALLEKLARVFVPKTMDAGGKMMVLARKSTPNVKEDGREVQAMGLKFKAEAKSTWGDIKRLSPGDCIFTPKLEMAEVRVKALEELAGKDAKALVKLSDKYLQYGYDMQQNAGKVIAAFCDETGASEALGVDISGKYAAGMTQINSSLKGVSARVGAFAGEVEDFAKGVFDPEKFFNTDATILGGLSLKDILTKVQGLGDAAGDYAKIPGATVRHEDNRETGQRYMIVSYKWQTKSFKALEDLTAHAFVPVNGTTELLVHSEIKKNITTRSEPATYFTKGSLKKFGVKMLPGVPLVVVKFSEFSFESANGGSPKFTPKIEDVSFDGKLSYINELAGYIGLSVGGASVSSLVAAAEEDRLFSMSVNVTMAGVIAKTTINVPAIVLGVFALQNLVIRTILTLPFTKDPLKLDVAFSSIEKPFSISVMGVTGGGYFHLVTTSKAIELIEFSLEFGAQVAFSLGAIATGSVEIKGGVLMRFKDREISVTAFLRVSGSLKVLGLISVSVVFYLGLELTTFDKAGGGSGYRLQGEARVTVKISLCFFEKTVNLVLKRQLAGSDPRFRQSMDAPTWAAYCAAYAPALEGA